MGAPRNDQGVALADAGASPADASLPPAEIAGAPIDTLGPPGDTAGAPGDTPGALADANRPPNDAVSVADVDPVCTRIGPPSYLTGPEAYRWLVLVEATESTSDAVAYRVSGTEVTGAWRLGSGVSVRGEGFSPDGRFFLRHTWYGPAYLVDFQGSTPGNQTLVSQETIESSWSPTESLLLLQTDLSPAGVTLVDARCGSPLTAVLPLGAPPRMINPQPMWAPEGERVAFATDRATIELADFRTRAPSVASIAAEPMGLRTWDCQWALAGRWLACRAEPETGTWLVAGIDTASPNLPTTALTAELALQISYVTWASPDWLVYPTSDGTTSQWTYAARIDVLPASPTLRIPASARVSSTDAWVAYLDTCGPSSASGICLVQLGRDGASQPVQVAIGEPMEMGWARGGKHIYYTYWRGDHYEWWLIPNAAAGGIPIQPTTDMWWDRSYSPDGDWAVWRTGVDPDQKLYAYNIAEASTQLLLGGGYEALHWSRDGDFLAVLTADRTQVLVFAEQGHTLVEIARLDSSTGAFASWFLWQPTPQ